MNARVLSYTNVTPMPCVLTLRDGTSAAVLEDTREMVNFALVRNHVPQKTEVLLCHAILVEGLCTQNCIYMFNVR